MVVTDENGKEATVKINTDGDKGAIEVQSADGGNMKFGGAAGASRCRAWMPVYPGSSPTGTFSSQTKDGSQSTFAFKTHDAPPKVMTYYQDQLKSGRLHHQHGDRYSTGRHGDGGGWRENSVGDGNRGDGK